MVLSIGRDGLFAVNSEKVAADRLVQRLTEVFARRGQRVLFVKAAGGLEFQNVATAIDKAREANITSVALIPRE